MQSSDRLNLVAFIAALLFAAGATYWRRWSVGRRITGDAEGDNPEESAIISYYTPGHEIIAGGHKVSGDLHYSIYATGPLDPSLGGEFVTESAVIYALDLPYNTQSHIVGLSKSFKIDRLQFASFLQAKGMEKITLEGDFPDHFDLYAMSDQGMQVRYVLEPDTMAFVEQYCSSYFWEIHNSQLYAVEPESATYAGDFMGESRRFVTAMQPALLPGQPGAPAVRHDVPYGVYDGPALACPICQEIMTLSENWQTCPDGHGVLISGRDLEQLHNHAITIQADATKAKEHATLTCPNCKHQMAQVRYDKVDQVIDSCMYCPFRWLDANEVVEISAIQD